MDLLDKSFSELLEENKRLRAENEYLKSPGFLWDVCEIIKGEYSSLLAPPRKEFHTSWNQKSSMFEIDVNEIVCILSRGKYKWIYFNELQSSISGIKHEARKLVYTGNFQEILQLFDPQEIHLCQVSKSAVVNLFYYYLDRNKLVFNDNNDLLDSVCSSIPVSSDYLERYKQRKLKIANLITFLKIEFRGKYSPLDSLHDNFGS